MLITINDKPHNLTDQSTVSELLLMQQINQQGLAVAVNNNVVPKRLWSEYQLMANDQIQLFQIVTGG